MYVFFELLDAASGNVLAGFDNEPDALAALRAFWHDQGSEALA